MHNQNFTVLKIETYVSRSIVLDMCYVRLIINNLNYTLFVNIYVLRAKKKSEIYLPFSPTNQSSFLFEIEFLYF